MIMFLRKGNETIVDVEVNDGKISTSIDIKAYSLWLITRDSTNDQFSIINNFSDLQELNDYWYETSVSDDYDSMESFVKSILKTMADRFDLNYVED